MLLQMFSEHKQHTNCCNSWSLVEDIFGTHVLDGLSIDSLLRGRIKKTTFEP